MVAEARQRHPDVMFAEGDAERLAFPDSSFDAVVMNFGLLHLSNPESALAEAHRVLRHGGRYAFTVWASPEQAVGFGIVLGAIERHGTLEVGLPAGPPFFRFSEAEECRRFLELAGFDAPEIRHLPLVWRLSSAGDVFDALSRGGVRTAAVLRAQTPAALAAIRADIEREIAGYAQDDGFVVPMPAVLAAAAKSA